jgi:outer membrane protein assembly factor BamB
MNNRNCLALLLPVCLLTGLIVVNDTVAQDWAQWRGNNRDGILVPAIEQIRDVPKLNWESDVAGGYSGPTIVDGRVYVMDRVEKPKQIERVLCFDEKTGKPIWSHEYDAAYKGIGYTAGPRASVTVIEGEAYSVGAMGHAFSFNAENGEVLWEKNFDAEYSISTSKRMPIWGIAGSPLIVGKNVVFHVGGSDGACIVALDRESGNEVCTG